MKRSISQWPALNVRVNPAILQRIEDAAEARSLPVTAIVREALDKAFATSR